MKNKWLQLEVFHKSILTSLILAILFVLISSILVLINTSYLYGALVGLGILYLSYLVIWILWYKIPKIKLFMAQWTPVFAPLIRIVIFTLTFLLISLIINNGSGIEIFLNPINTIMMLITYTSTLLSYLIVIVIDSNLEKRKTTEVKQ